MKSKVVIIFICMLFFSSITSSFATWNQSEQEEVTLKLSLIKPTMNRIIEKKLPKEQADYLIDLCKNYHSNPSENTLFINSLQEYVLTDDEYEKIDVKKFLKPYNYSNIQKIIPKKTAYSTSTASQFCCTISSGGSGRVFPFFLLPRPRLFLNWRGNSENDMAITTAGSLIKDQGFRAYGGQSGYALGFTGMGLTYGSPIGRVYGFTGYTLFTSVVADQIDVFYPANDAPTISNPTPSDGEKMVPLSLSELSFTISDKDNDLMGYSVTTNPYIGIGSSYLKRDGTYSLPISNLAPSTTYEWTVEVDDGKSTTSETYSFTTVKEEPIVLNPNPKDQTSASTSLSQISFELYDAQGDLMDYTVETSPNIGSKTGTQRPNGTITVPIQGLQKDTLYHWYVNVTDGIHWIKEKFSFFTGDIGLIGYWNFDEGSGNTLHDLSQNKHHGEINGATWIENGKSNAALLFDGINDYISLKEFTSEQDQGTVTAWVKYETPDGEKGIIFGKGVENENKPYIALGVNGGKLIFERDVHGLTSLYQAYSTDKQINDGNWHFLVWMSTGDENKFYIDGNEVTMNWKKGQSNGIWFNDQLTETNSFGVIDRKENWCYFKGGIDEVRIYDIALSLSEIKNLYEHP